MIEGLFYTIKVVFVVVVVNHQNQPQLWFYKIHTYSANPCGFG